MLSQSSHAAITSQLTDVITAKISDHQPVIHDGLLLWNIMMQGKARRRSDMSMHYNNGFGIVENEQQYLRRLEKISRMIAGIVEHSPDISIIGICEGPIVARHSKIFFRMLQRFPSLEKFLYRKRFEKPAKNTADDWGLLMLTERNDKIAREDFLDEYISANKAVTINLAKRFQLWSLEHDGRKKYFALTHLPFCGNEYATEKSQLSAAGILYCDLIQKLLDKYTDAELLVGGDFNFNPHLINTWQERFADSIPSHNSRIFAEAETSVTVDGILLSRQEKQKFYGAQTIHGLFSKLKRDYRLGAGDDAGVNPSMLISVNSKLDNVLDAGSQLSGLKVV